MSNPISEASTVLRKGYFVLGIDSGAEMKQFLIVEEDVVDLVSWLILECFPVIDHRRV